MVQRLARLPDVRTARPLLCLREVVHFGLALPVCIAFTFGRVRVEDLCSIHGVATNVVSFCSLNVHLMVNNLCGFAPMISSVRQTDLLCASNFEEPASTSMDQKIMSGS